MKLVRPKVVNDSVKLNELKNSIQECRRFADLFQFNQESDLCQLIQAIDPTFTGFMVKNWYYNEFQHLYISLRSHNTALISTNGFVAPPQKEKNKRLSAFVAQAISLSALIKYLQDQLLDESVYDFESFKYEEISSFTPAFFQNVVFFLELFMKAFLAISGKPAKNIHELSKLFNAMCESMFELDLNDTPFHANILPICEKYVIHIAALPEDFKEHFIKYEDNKNDNTVLELSRSNLDTFNSEISLCRDFILSYSENQRNCSMLKKGYFAELFSNANNDFLKAKVALKYSFLLETDCSRIKQFLQASTSKASK